MGTSASTCTQSNPSATFRFRLVGGWSISKGEFIAWLATFFFGLEAGDVKKEYFVLGGMFFSPNQCLQCWFQLCGQAWCTNAYKPKPKAKSRPVVSAEKWHGSNWREKWMLPRCSHASCLPATFLYASNLRQLKFAWNSALMQLHGRSGVWIFPVFLMFLSKSACIGAWCRWKPWKSTSSAPVRSLLNNASCFFYATAQFVQEYWTYIFWICNATAVKFGLSTQQCKWLSSKKADWNK